jgi:FkbM family methyltransferase
MELEREIYSAEILEDGALYVRLHGGEKLHLRPNDPAIMDVHRKAGYTYSEDNIGCLKHIRGIHEKGNLDNYIDGLCILFGVAVQKEYERHYHPEHDDEIMDIGANVGVAAVRFGRQLGRDGRLIAVEPMPGNLEYLRRNIEENKLKDTIEVVPAAAWNEKGTESMFVGKAPGWNKISDNDGMVYGYQRMIQVATDTVDNIVKEYGLTPSFMKIDTEGSEIPVITGAKNTIRSYPISMAIEAHSVKGKNNGDAIKGMLRNMGMHIQPDTGVASDIIFARKAV